MSLARSDAMTTAIDHEDRYHAVHGPYRAAHALAARPQRPGCARLSRDRIGGDGWWVPANDKVVTIAGFILIVGFPILVFLLSLAYNRLEQRRLDRCSAAKARQARADLRGGW